MESNGKNNIIPIESVRAKQQLAAELSPSVEEINKLQSGATYICFEDAVILQKELLESEEIETIIDNDYNNDDVVKVLHKCNWIKFIVICQKIDSCEYRQRFPMLLQLNHKTINTQIIWLISGFMA